MALFLDRQRCQAKRITLNPRRPIGPSPLQQTEPAYPAASRNKQAGPATTATRRLSQGSASQSSGMSSRASSSSMSSKNRRDSGTAFLSRISLSPDLKYLVTHIEPVDNRPIYVEHDTCKELCTVNGNLIRLRLNRFPRNEKPSKCSKKYLDIPLKFLYYDRNDKVAIECIRAREFVDCRVDVKFKLFPQTETAAVYGKPVLSLDGGEAWADCPGTFKVIDYIEEETAARWQSPLKLLGKLKLRGQVFGALWVVWMRGAYVKMDNFEPGENCNEIDEYARAGSRRILRKWIKEGRLVMRAVQVNTLGRPIKGNLALLGKVYDPDYDSDEDWDA